MSTEAGAEGVNTLQMSYVRYQANRRKRKDPPGAKGFCIAYSAICDGVLSDEDLVSLRPKSS